MKTLSLPAVLFLTGILFLSFAQAYVSDDPSGQASIETAVLPLQNGVICPPDTIVAMQVIDDCAAWITFPPVEVSPPGGFLINDFNLTDDASGHYPLGTTVVTYTYIDPLGDTSTCSFEVEVVDVFPPFVNCQDITVELDAFGSVTLNPNELSAGSFDNCDVLTLSTDPEVLTCNELGVNPVVLQAIDFSGNEAACVAQVTVVDNLPPEIYNCPPNITISIPAGESEGVVTFDPPLVVDNCQATMSCTHQSGDLFPLGITGVVCTAMDDAGNSVECTFLITVETEELQQADGLCGKMVMTLYGYGNDSPVIGIYNTENNSSYTDGPGWNWSLQAEYPTEATPERMGQVFGLCIADDDCIYVAASTVYGDEIRNNMAVPPVQTVGTAGSGGIYRLCRVNGQWEITNFVETSATPGTVGTTTLFNEGAGLGNICYDPDHDQFFVSNFQDGLIYRLAGPGQPNPGEVLSTYDHNGLMLHPSRPTYLTDWAPLGERIWGVGYHQNTLYYSVWNENWQYRNDANHANEIHSVDLNGSGDFSVPAGTNLEITLPNLTGRISSSPVSDIAFSHSGSMLLAERALDGDIGFASHRTQQWNAFQGRLMEYEEVGNTWQQTQLFYVGNYRADNYQRYHANSAGGCDYGYGYKANHSIDLNACDSMAWSTGDRLMFAGHNNSPANDQQVYGATGIPVSGNSDVANDPDWVASTSWFIDAEGTVRNRPIFETMEWIGDLEFFKCGCVDTPLEVQCDSLGTDVMMIGSQDSCCWRYRFGNPLDEPIVRIEAAITAGPASFDVNLVTHPDVVIGTPLSGTVINLTHTAGTFPQGEADIMDYCLTGNAGQSSTITYRYYAINDHNQEELVCEKTVEHACDNEIDLLCTEILIDSIACLEDQLTYQVWMRVVNHSAVTLDYIWFDVLHGGTLENPAYSGASFHNFLPDLPPNGTSAVFSVEVTPNTANLPASFCFRTSVVDVSGDLCCTSDDTICLVLEPCCEPCDGREVTVHALPDECCYSLDIGTQCPLADFVALETEVITPGVIFGSHNLGDENATYWHNPAGDDRWIRWEQTDGSAFSGSFEGLIEFCLDEITDPAQVPQQVVLSWVESVSGQDTIVCRDTLVFDCPPPVLNECFDFTINEASCQGNGEYLVDFTITNTSPYVVDRFSLTPFPTGGLELTQFQWNQVLQPGDHFSGTVTVSNVSPGELCIVARLMDSSQLNGDSIQHFCCFDTLCIDLPVCDSCCPVTSVIESIEQDGCILTLTPGDIDSCERYDWWIREWDIVKNLPIQTICSQNNAGPGSYTCTVTADGYYNVCLTTIAFDNSVPCEDDTCAIIMVNGCSGVDPCCPVDASFLASVPGCTINTIIGSNDTCEHHSWEVFPSDGFGNISGPAVCSETEVDGTTWSCSVPGNGTYLVCHIVTVLGANGLPVCTDTVCNQYQVMNCDSCYVSTTWVQEDSCGTVGFTSQTSIQNPVYDWDFGDMNHSSDPDPVHVYGVSGTYTVCLTVTDGNCTTTDCQVVTVVRDDLPPTVICVSEINVDISAGSVTIDVGDVDLGSYGYCSPDDLWLDRTSFSCADACLDISIHLLAEDCCGNQAMCEIVVHVSSENVPPMISCPPDVTIVDNDPIDPTGPTYTDNCNNNLIPIREVEWVAGTNCPVVEFLISWKVQDYCMNSASCIQHLTLLCDSIRTGCDPVSNLVSNGTFGGPWGPTGSHESIGGAVGWGAIWNNANNVGGTGDLWNTIFTPSEFNAALQNPVPNTSGNYAGFWVSNSQDLTEGIMNELVTTLLQEDACYKLTFEVACLLDNGGWGAPTLDVYGCQTTGFGNGMVTMPNPPNLSLFPNTVLLGSYQIPSGCDNSFTTNPPDPIIFNASSFPASGIDHIFFTRSNGTMGGQYIGLDNVCLERICCGDCPIENAGIEVDINHCEVDFHPTGLEECDRIEWEIFQLKKSYISAGVVILIKDGPPILSGSSPDPTDWNVIMGGDGDYQMEMKVIRETSQGTCKKVVKQSFNISDCSTCTCAIESSLTEVSMQQSCNDLEFTANSQLRQCDYIYWNFGDGTGEWTQGPGSSVMHTYANPGIYLVKYQIVRQPVTGNLCAATGQMTVVINCINFNSGIGTGGIILNPHFSGGLFPGDLSGGGQLDNWDAAFGHPVVSAAPGCPDAGYVRMNVLNTVTDGIIQEEVPFDPEATYYIRMCVNQPTADYTVEEGFDPLPRIVLLASKSDPDPLDCQAPECTLIGMTSLFLEPGWTEVAFPGWRPGTDYDRLTILPVWVDLETGEITGQPKPDGQVFEFRIDGIEVTEVPDCNPTVTFDNYLNRARGGACLSVDAGDLLVSHLDTSGNSAVRVEFGQVDEAVLHFKEDQNLLDQPGATLEVMVSGLSSNFLEEELATVGFRRTDKGDLELYATGADSFRVTVLMDGMPVQAFDLPSGTLGDLPGLGCCNPEDIRSDVDNITCPKFKTPFSFLGTTGDGLQVFPYKDQGFQAVTAMTARAAHTPGDQFILVKEEGLFNDCTRHLFWEEGLVSARGEACLTGTPDYLEASPIGTENKDGLLVAFENPDERNEVHFHEPLLLDSMPDTRASFTAFGDFPSKTDAWIQTVEFIQTGPGVVDVYGYADAMKASGFIVTLFDKETELSSDTMPGNYLGQLKGPDGFTGNQADPIPGVDIALEQIPGGIRYVFTGTFTYSNGKKATELLIRPEFTVLPERQTHLEVVAAHVPGDRLRIDRIFSEPDTTTSVQHPSVPLGNLRVFPNPVSGNLTVQWSEPEKEQVRIRVTDLHGRLIEEQILAPGHYLTVLDTQGWASGLYLLSCTGEHGASVHRKVVKVE